MTTQAIAVREEFAIDAALQWTPETLRANIQRESQLRDVVLEYFRSAMKQGHHYYTIGDGKDGKDGKPALSKEGSLNICSLFKVTPSVDVPDETYHADGHYTVRVRCHILDRSGQIVATGDGMCSTRESKYAYRWLFDNEVPEEIDVSTLKKRTGESKYGKKWTRYQCPNQDLADSYNTVLKMADKRAMVAAALKLPLVSELFTQDLEDQIKDNQTAKSATTTSRRATAGGGGSEGTNRQPPAGHRPIEDIMNELNLNGDSIQWGADSDACLGYVGNLLGRKVAKIDQLTGGQQTMLARDLEQRLADLKDQTAEREAIAAEAA